VIGLVKEAAARYRPSMSRVEEIRRNIEDTDRRLLTLIHERMQLAEQVAQVKLETASPIRDPERESRVVNRVRETAAEIGLDPHATEQLFRLVIEMAVSRQQTYLQSLDTTPLRVAYQGIEGSYSHLAAQQRYGGRTGGAMLFGFDTVRQVTDELKSGRVDLALLPIETTTAGSMNEVYVALAESSFSIAAEVYSPIEHRLLVLPGVTLSEIRTVLSAPQALAQCDAFFRSSSGVRPEPTSDTALAAQRVAERKDRSLAAIASQAAARLFGLEVLPIPLTSQAGDYTRFVEVTREAVPATPGVDHKTSLILVLEDRPGALTRVLSVLAQHRLNLSKLESRPLPGMPPRYRFYLDVSGHAATGELAQALEELRPECTEIRNLGSYPAATVS
jgi:chorismate mutase/prephenate dehydratase